MSDPFELSKGSVKRGLALVAGKDPATLVPKPAKTSKRVLRARGVTPAAAPREMVKKSDPFEVEKAFGSAFKIKGFSGFGQKAKDTFNAAGQAGFRKTVGGNARAMGAIGSAHVKNNKKAYGLGAATAAGGLATGGLLAKPKEKDPFAKAADPFELAKGELTRSDASTGRKVTAVAFAPYHGLVAGKKGRKLRAAGNQLAGGVLGGTVGRVAGAVATRGSLAGAGVGQLAGGATGVVMGTNRAQNKGHFKPQKKS